MLINRCVCSNIKFSEVKKIMTENNLSTLEQVREFIEVSQNCQLCAPYINKMIETGETEFNYIITKE
ncbi:MAG: (2Fe-2S)-binding protein [Ignavibacteria bacterium]|nr:(2Fe-2S)-binding protein [Ignavibacteria bacterium]